MNGDTQGMIGKKISEARLAIKSVGNDVLSLKTEITASAFPQGVEVGEMIANVILAYRHLEDAAMRLGKAIQAYEGGKSIYDSNDAARVAANGPVEAGTYANEKGSETA